MKHPLVSASAVLVMLVAGCAGPPDRGYGPDAEADGPPAEGETMVDVDALPDVVPRNEPLSPYGNPESYEVFGETYHVKESAQGYAAEGIASWYGRKFHGQRTSSGEPYDMFALTAAHTSLPLPTYVRVTHLDNGRSIVVKVNDRGPFVDNRLIDLSYAAARRLDMHDSGTAPVRVEALPEGTPLPAGATAASASGAEDSRGDAANGSAQAPPKGPNGEPGDGRAWIQLGAFSRFDNAHRLRVRAVGAYIRNVSVQRARNEAGARVYRVRIGPLDDGSERDRVFERLQRAGIEPGRVVFE